MTTALPRTTIRAAGGLVVRGQGEDIEYLLAHRPRYDDWSIPKGKLNNGEKFRDGALREIEEETGAVTSPIAKLGSIAYETPNGNGKVVRYWLLQAEGGQFTPNAEVDAVGWFAMKKAWKRMTYSRDREVLEWAATLHERPTAARVFLIRHADVVSGKHSSDDDELRPLSKLGVKQTSALQDMLTRNPVTRVYSSHTLRCSATVEPIAQSLQMEIRHHEALEEGRPPEMLADALAELQGHSSIICSHGDVISSYIGLVAAEGAKIAGPLRWAKGSVWVLDLANGRVRRARYLPAAL
jgi:8-oxo-dGTP diphosphatase